MDTAARAVTVLLDTGGGGIVPRGTRVEVFNRIFDVFLLLGTLVGIVVITYMCWKAYKYRQGGGHVDEESVERPELGELPQGSGGGRKLFVSFAMSAIIVISLIVWTYGTLLYVEQAAAADDGGAVRAEGSAQQFQVAEESSIRIEVIGSQFAWEFVYPNGYRTDVLRVPRGMEVQLTVTASDVFHNFGIPAFRVKADAIPGQTATTWFVADETGTYTAHCYELCGAGHSYMDAQVVVMEPSAFEEWYADTEPSNTTGESGAGAGAAAVAGPVEPTGVSA